MQTESDPIFAIEAVSNIFEHKLLELFVKLESGSITIPKSIVKVAQSGERIASRTAVVPSLHLFSSGNNLESPE